MKEITFANHGPEYEKKLSQAIIQDHQFAEQMMDILPPDYFTQKYLQIVVQNIYDFRRKYNSYPSPESINSIVQTSQNISELLKTEVDSYLKECVKRPLNGDMRYIQESSWEFCKKQTFGVAIAKILDELDNNNFDAIQTHVKEAMNKGSSRDLGEDYLDLNNLAYYLASGRGKIFPTGFKLIDNIIDGIEEGTINCVVSPSGGGKSHMLVNLSGLALMAGYNVVYITLELSAKKIAHRHYAFWSGVDINEVSKHHEIVEAAIKDKVKGQLRIKKYPTLGASVETIRAYVNRLQASEGIKYDLLVVDYPDLLRPVRHLEFKRFELESNFDELRGMGEEMKMGVWVADQTNRSGLTAEIIGMEHIAEAYNKLMRCDSVFTIGRTMLDRKNGTGRIHFAKSRYGGEGTIIPFLLDAAKVKFMLREPDQEDAVENFKDENENLIEHASKQYDAFKKSQKKN